MGTPLLIDWREGLSEYPSLGGDELAIPAWLAVILLIHALSSSNIRCLTMDIER